MTGSEMWWNSVCDPKSIPGNVVKFNTIVGVRPKERLVTDKRLKQ